MAKELDDQTVCDHTGTAWVVCVRWVYGRRVEMVACSSCQKVALNVERAHEPTRSPLR